MSRSGSAQDASTWMPQSASRWPSAVSISPTRPNAPPIGCRRTADIGDGATSAPATIVSIGGVGQLVDEAEAVVGPRVVRLARRIEHRLQRAVGHRLHGVERRPERAQRARCARRRARHRRRRAPGRRSRGGRAARPGRPAAAARSSARGRRRARRAPRPSGRGTRASPRAARSRGHISIPPRMIGPTGRSANSNSTTIPKFPPPPRSAQNRSAFSSCGRGHDAAVGREHARGAQVVGREAHLALEPAAAGAEREAGDAGRRGPAAGDGEAVLLRRGVELAPQHAGLHPGDLAHRVDVDALHRPDVDHQPAVGHREPGRRMASGAARPPPSPRPAHTRARRRRRRPTRSGRSAPAGGRSCRCGRGARRRSRRRRGRSACRRSGGSWARRRGGGATCSAGSRRAPPLASGESLAVAAPSGAAATLPQRWTVPTMSAVSVAPGCRCWSRIAARARTSGRARRPSSPSC